MKVKDVAKMLGKSEMTIRIGLQQGVFPFGTAFKTDEKSKNYTYVIYPELVKKYISGRGDSNDVE